MRPLPSTAGRGVGLFPRRLLVVALLAGAACAPGDGSSGAPPGEDGPAARATDEAAREGPAPVRVVDHAGHTLELDRPPERIVSLVPSATETLVALGRRDRLVARTDFDTATALADLPSVGGGLHPSREVLLSLDPDLVLRFAGPTDPETASRLDAAGIPHLAVRPERIADVRDMIALLGTVTGAGEAADSILAEQTRTLDRIAERIGNGPSPEVAFLVGSSPPWAAGGASFLGDLVERAGGRNVFADLDRPYASVSPESIRKRAPDVLLVVRGTEVDARLREVSRVAEVSPVVQRPGPRLHEAVLAIARALHPERFDAGPGSRPTLRP